MATAVVRVVVGGRLGLARAAVVGVGLAVVAVRAGAGAEVAWGDAAAAVVGGSARGVVAGELGCAGPGLAEGGAALALAFVGLTRAAMRERAAAAVSPDAAKPRVRKLKRRRPASR